MEHFAEAEGAQHFRIKLFAEMTGLSHDAEAHNARMMPYFVYPTLDALFEDPAQLRVKLSTPMHLDALLGGLGQALPESLNNSEMIEQLRAIVEPARRALASKARVYDVDHALFLAFKVFKVADALACFRRVRATDVVVRIARRWLEKHLATKSLSPSAPELQTGNVSPAPLGRRPQRNKSATALGMIDSSTEPEGGLSPVPLPYETHPPVKPLIRHTAQVPKKQVPLNG